MTQNSAMSTYVRRVGMLLCCLSLLACQSSSPRLESRELLTETNKIVPTRFLHQPNQDDLTPWGVEAWWEQLQDPQLSRWIDRAFINNKDLKVTLARVSQARAQWGIASSTRMPTLNAVATSSQTNGGNRAMGTIGAVSGTLRDQLAFQASYEFDFWGRREFSVESAFQQINSAEFGVQSFRLSLAAEIAGTYYRLLAVAERVQIIRKMIDMAQKNTEDIRRKMKVGEATQVMVAQQLIFLQSLLAQEQDLLFQQESGLIQLSILAGEAPSAVPFRFIDLDLIRLPITPIGMPSSLLCRRPDLMQAEASLRAADADVAVARAVMLPNISLSLMAGQVAPGLNGLTAGASGFLQTSLFASQSIFDSGARRQGVALTEARRTELIERYAGAVINALRDVENALSSVQKSAEKAQWLEKNRAQSNELARLTKDMMEKGSLDFVQLIQIQTALYTAEDASVIGRLDRILAQIDLYKALGGRVQTQAPSCDLGRRQ